MSDSQLNSGTGVDYTTLDAFKRLALKCAAKTAGNIRRTEYAALEWTRGESAFLFQGSNGKIIGHVHEGLGTKNLVADAMGGIYYRNIARDTVAMGVNDLVTLGVLPISVSMHLSVGDATSWFKNSDRAEHLIRGWKEACDDAECVWSCGETPELNGIIIPSSAELSCSVVGSGTIAHVMNPIKVTDGDAIIFLASSGIHANGLTKAREVAGMLSVGLDTHLVNGRSFGEALLTPTIIYAQFVRECQEAQIYPHYAVNITGHGLRKLMRAQKSLRYEIDRLPDPILPEFQCIQDTLRLTDEQMYAAFNMGVGFAVYANRNNADAIVAIAKDRCGINAWVAGTVHEAPERSVVLKQKGITYQADSMEIR